MYRTWRIPFHHDVSHRALPLLGRRALTTRGAWLTSDFVKVTPEVRAALAERRPVVALESTIITHGMPYPDNLAVAQAVEAIVRDQGCIPATIALWDGKVQVGLDTARLEQLAQTGRTATKASRRDLAAVLSRRLPGATTVASTMLIAHRCGIPLFVTGGIGGVHRGAESTLDVSADLTELGRTPVAVVCSGTKSILDIPKTLEYLETQGVPVVTVGAGGPQFPAFFTPDSGHRSAWWVDGHHEAARFVHTQFHLSIDTGVVLAVPIPAGEAAQGDLIQAAIDQAVWEAADQGVLGKDITPFLLQRVNEITQGASLQANIGLIKNNARVGGQIARELCALEHGELQTCGVGLPAPSSTDYGPRAVAAPADSNVTLMIVGGCAVDVISTIRASASTDNLPTARLTPLGTSNPGVTHYTLGGVGYNVARVCAQLGERPRFLSWVGPDANGDLLLRDMVARGLDTELIVRVPEARTAVYNAIHDAGGELITAVADMDILATTVLPTVQRDALQAALMAPPGPVLVCFDGNLSRDTIRQLCATLSAIPRGPCTPVIWTVFEPTSAPKALKLLATCPFDPQVRSSLTPFRETVVQLVTPDRAELASLADTLPTELIADQLLVTIDDMMAASCATARNETNRPTPPAYPADLPRILQKAARLLTFIPQLVVKLGADGVIVCSRRWVTPSDHVQQRPSVPHEGSAGLPLGTLLNTVCPMPSARDPLAEQLEIDWAYLPSLPCTQVRSVAGAGDSMVGAMLAGLVKYCRQLPPGNTDTPMAFVDLVHIVNVAQRAAVLSIQSTESVSPDIEPSLLADLTFTSGSYGGGLKGGPWFESNR